MKEFKLFLEAGEGEETDCPLKSPDRNATTRHLDFKALRLSEISNLKNYEIINLCCLKIPSNLWQQ